MCLRRDFIEVTTVLKINSNFSFSHALFPLSLGHTKGHCFFAALLPLSAVVYCFIRWITFLGVFKKRESLCLCFAGVLKQFRTPLLVDFDVTQLCGTSVLSTENETFRLEFPWRRKLTFNILRFLNSCKIIIPTTATLIQLNLQNSIFQILHSIAIIINHAITWVAIGFSINRHTSCLHNDLIYVNVKFYFIFLRTLICILLVFYSGTLHHSFRLLLVKSWNNRH